MIRGLADYFAPETQFVNMAICKNPSNPFFPYKNKEDIPHVLHFSA
jgi:hypothetical protein